MGAVGRRDRPGRRGGDGAGGGGDPGDPRGPLLAGTARLDMAHPDVHPLLIALVLHGLLGISYAQLWNVHTTHYVLWPYFGAVVGLCVGIAQSRVLKRYLPGGKGWQWIGMCSLGTGIGFLLFVPIQFAVLQGWGLYD